MTALPASSDFTGSTVTEGQAKTAYGNQRAFLAGLLGTDGTVATALATLGALGSAVVTKSAAYSVVSSDRGTVINCNSGPWTLSLLAGWLVNLCVCPGIHPKPLSTPSSLRVKSIWRPTHTPKTSTAPDLARLSSGSRSPESLSFCMAVSNEPTPGNINLLHSDS